jgi:hypothetical protein
LCRIVTFPRARGHLSGGICITEEQELHVQRRRLATFPEAMQAVIQAAHALRRPVGDLSVADVEA